MRSIRVFAVSVLSVLISSSFCSPVKTRQDSFPFEDGDNDDIVVPVVAAEIGEDDDWGQVAVPADNDDDDIITVPIDEDSLLFDGERSSSSSSSSPHRQKRSRKGRCFWPFFSWGYEEYDYGGPPGFGPPPPMMGMGMGPPPFGGGPFGWKKRNGKKVNK